MTRQERARIRKLRSRALIFGIIIVLLGILGLGKRLFGFSNIDSIVVRAQANEDVIKLKSPAIVELDNNLEKIRLEEQTLKLSKIREEIKREKLEAQIEKDKNLKIAYLTFDDGPSTKSTPAILDILKREGIKATFFVQGQNISYYPEIFKRVYDEGHAIGHHSYSHNYDYLYSSTDNFMNDIYKTEKVMQDVLGSDFKTHLLRLPGGAFGKKKMHYVDVAASKGYTNYNWNALNGDAEGHGLSSGHLINRLKATVGGQRQIIILMHDTNAKATTVQSLPASIKYLRDRGYEFRTLNEL